MSENKSGFVYSLETDVVTINAKALSKRIDKIEERLFKIDQHPPDCLNCGRETVPAKLESGERIWVCILGHWSKDRSPK